MLPPATNDHIKSLARIENALQAQVLRLEQVERRLGTDMESESDFDEAREIAHKVSNLQLLLTLTQTRPLRDLAHS